MCIYLSLFPCLSLSSSLRLTVLLQRRRNPPLLPRRKYARFSDDDTRELAYRRFQRYLEVYSRQVTRIASPGVGMVKAISLIMYRVATRLVSRPLPLSMENADEWEGNISFIALRKLHANSNVRIHSFVSPTVYKSISLGET